jgi:hypothetical protein
MGTFLLIAECYRSFLLFHHQTMSGTVDDLRRNCGEVSYENLLLVVDCVNYVGKPGMTPKTKSTFEWKISSIKENYIKMTKTESKALLKKSPVLTGTGPLRRAIAYDLIGEVPLMGNLKEQESKKSILPTKTFTFHTILNWIDNVEEPQPQEQQPQKPQPQEPQPQDLDYVSIDDTFQLKTIENQQKIISKQQQIIAELNDELSQLRVHIDFIDDE